MNTGAMMITGIRYAAFGQKQREPFVDGLCIAIIAVAFDKEKTTRGTCMPDRHSIPIGYILL